jgi:membrane-bound lytic murein transglycosylase D
LPKEKIAVFASNEDKIYAYVQNELDLRENPLENIGLEFLRK